VRSKVRTDKAEKGIVRKMRPVSNVQDELEINYVNETERVNIKYVHIHVYVYIYIYAYISRALSLDRHLDIGPNTFFIDKRS